MPKYRLRPEELALLAEVHANPREDAPRLAHAAWLESNRNPRLAEFIRLHIDPNYRRYYEEYLHELAIKNRSSWLRSVPSDITAKYSQARYFKGLPHLDVNCQWSQWPTLFSSLAEWLHPRCQVELFLYVTSTSDLTPALAHPLMERIAWLHILSDRNPDHAPEPRFMWEMRRLPLTVAQTEAVTEFPHFSRLHRLVFSDLTPEGEKIASARIVPHVPTAVYGRTLS